MLKTKELLDFWFPNYTCMACGKEIDTSDNAYLCADCLEKLPIVTEKQTTHFAPFYYAEPVRSMILKLKYGSNGFIAKALAPYLVAIYLQQFPDHHDHVIVPVPLHHTREQERGYNQSLALAQEFQSYINLPIANQVIIRHRKTTIQKDMDYATRFANMQDAFAIVPEHVDDIKDRDVLLLDDVYTTGATTNACAQILRQHGARKITILTIATVNENCD